MQHLQETNLAWSLIEAAKPELDVRERNHVFVSVGAGDSFTAIRILLKLIATKRISLNEYLVQLCATWLEAYEFHEDHAQLAVLIDGMAVPSAELRPAAIVRSLTRMRNPAALPTGAHAHHERSVSARAG